MSDDRLLPVSGATDLPTFSILSDGEELPKSVQVVSLMVNKTINRVPVARIILKDGDASAGDFLLSNESILLPGKEIEISAGYHSDHETLFKGIVVKHSVQVRGKRNKSSLVIECKDKAYRMTVGLNNKYFSEMKDSDAIEEIIQNHNLEMEVEGTDATHQGLVQYSASDWDFMISRAEINGQLVLVGDGKITVAKPDFSSESKVKLMYGATILDIDATLDASYQHSDVVCSAWDQANQEIIESQSATPDVEESGNLASSDLAGLVSDESTNFRHTGNLTAEELQAWANARKTKNVLSKICGVVKCKGIPNVKPGDMIELDGVGDRFNGKVIASGIRYELSEGFWSMDVQFGLPSEMFTASRNVTDLPASGLLPAVNGLQIGVVSQLQDDPDGEDRVLVKMPVVDPEADGTWARVASLDAGENRGAFFRPEIGDEVVLGFLNSDPRSAVILGMLNSSNKPAPIVASDDNHEKGFYTRDAPLKLIFNDELKSILLETPNGNLVKLIDDEGMILIEDENGNKIQMNSDGISIESSGDINIKASGNVNIEGVDINLAASGSLKAAGGSGAEIALGATADIKGSVVNIN